jgi:hypothetical protein
MSMLSLTLRALRIVIPAQAGIQSCKRHDENAGVPYVIPTSRTQEIKTGACAPIPD